MSHPRLAPGVIVRELPDGDAVAATAEGERAVILNPTARALIDLLDGSRGPSELAAVIRSCWPDLAPAEVERDVGALVDALVDAGLVECDASSSV